MVMVDEENRHRRKEHKLKCILETEQQLCKHPLKSFHADPAGDTSESYYECNYCGKIL